MKVSLSVITRGNHASLSRLLRSVVPIRFDEIVVVETNGGDPDVKRVCGWHGARYETYVDPKKAEFEKFCEQMKLGVPDHFSDFAHARNFAFSLCSNEWVCWMDSDDIAKNPTLFRKDLEDAVVQKKEAVKAFYLYEKDSRGNPTTVQWRERIVRKGAGAWKPFIHELYIRDGGAFDFHNLSKERFHVEHLRPPKKDGISPQDMRNYRILAFHYLTDGDLESRLWKELGRSCRGLGRYQEACFAYERHIETSNWPLDHFFALTDIGLCLRAMGLVKEATGYDLRALEIGPQYPQAYAGLAKDEIMANRYTEALAFAETGIARLEMGEHDTSHAGYNPTGTAMMLYQAQYRALYELGRHTDAQRPLGKLLKLDPDSQDFRSLWRITSEELHKAELAKSMATVFDAVIREEDDEKLVALSSAVPKSVLDLPPYQFLKRKEPPRSEGSPPSLAIVCPQREPRFGPSSLKSGVGGSEEAVIHMAPALAEAGFYVDVFHDTLEEGEHGDGAAKHRWYPMGALKKNHVYDHVVVWRYPELLKSRYSARTNALWLHDLSHQSRYSKEVLSNLDLAIVLSGYHGSVLSHIPEEKVLYSRNGIHPDWLSEPANDPKKVIYASNPTRGLKTLLEMWPSVREATGAELHIFYGFTTWHRKMVAYSPQEQKYMLEVKNLYDKVRPLGVIDHGMVGQKELSDWFAKCGVWAYPTQFEEISCITAMKAQAMGSVPVITNYAALKETVQFGDMVEWETGKEYPASEYEEALIQMILSPERQSQIRSEMVPWSRANFLWKPVAEQWYKALEFGTKERLCFPERHPQKKSSTLTLVT